MQTNFPGDVIMLKILIKERKNKRKLIPKEAKAYPIIGLSGSTEKSFSRQVFGA